MGPKFNDLVFWNDSNLISYSSGNKVHNLHSIAVIVVKVESWFKTLSN